MLLYEYLAIFLGLSASAVHGLDTQIPHQHHAQNLPEESTSTLSSATETRETKAETSSPAPSPCTIRSPTSGAFFDLNGLHIPDPSTLSEKQRARGPRDYSWNATGWDMGYNFTMNFCGGVIEDLDKLGGVVGVEKDLWRNVSAFYKQDGKVYSIGQQNMAPVIRGRKLVLNYTNGSPCDPPGSRDLSRENNDDPSSRELTTPSGGRRKSTIISMLCEKDPLMPQLTLSFIAASQDKCTYFFEARTNAACAGIETATQTLSPAGVFGVMLLITALVYLIGGCVYSRIVLQQRGWRQLPNYSLWAGILSFITDIFVILFSTCTRPFTRRGSGGGVAYSRINSGGRGSTARARDSDAENRLIDELNEEWDD